MFKYILYKLGQFLVNRLSPNFAYQLAIFFSDLQFLFSPRDRNAVRNNLKIVLQRNDNLTQPTREVFRNFGRYLVEFFRMEQDVTQAYVNKNVHIKNVKYLNEVKKQGKGGILITGHIGNWELGSAVMGLLGYEPMVIALPHKERPVNDLFNHQREIKGIQVIPTNTAVRRCIQGLKNNKFVALAADRDFSENGEVLKFLSRRAIIPKGAATFSIKTGAPIIPVFNIRRPDNTFDFIIEKPIYPKAVARGHIHRKSLISLMKRYTLIIEDKIRKYPSQWLMFREFWVK